MLNDFGVNGRRRKSALTRRLKGNSSFPQPVSPMEHNRNLQSVKKMFPNMKQSSNKPLFNPKAQIDESQIEDRTPKVDDYRDKLISMGKRRTTVHKRGY